MGNCSACIEVGGCENEVSRERALPIKIPRAATHCCGVMGAHIRNKLTFVDLNFEFCKGAR